MERVLIGEKTTKQGGLQSSSSGDTISIPQKRRGPKKKTPAEVPGGFGHKNVGKRRKEGPVLGGKSMGRNNRGAQKSEFA